MGQSDCLPLVIAGCLARTSGKTKSLGVASRTI